MGLCFAICFVASRREKIEVDTERRVMTTTRLFLEYNKDNVTFTFNVFKWPHVLLMVLFSSAHFTTTNILKCCSSTRYCQCSVSDKTMKLGMWNSKFRDSLHH